MRNLKRALSLALASIMVLGMMVVGAGAVSVDDFSDGEKIVNKEAVSVLTTLNVINGKDNGSYDPEGTVTRAEMAKMICVILNGGKDPSLGNATTNTFTDTVGHWASPYIEYCTKLGIISGRGDGTFDPNGNVTGSEASKMLLAASGYQAGIEGFTGANWEISTNVRANQVGLYDGLSIAPSTELTRDSAAQMVYNTLDIKVVTYKYTLTTDGSTVSSVPELQYANATGIVNITVLEDKFGAVKVEGVVVANEFADLSSGKTNSDYAPGVIGTSKDEGKTTLVITNSDDQSAYKGTETFNVSTGKNEMGRNVAIYVKAESNASKALVIGSPILTEDNKVVTDYTSDSLADVADDNDLEIASTTKVASNYASLTNYSKYTDPKTAGIEKLLIDFDDDGTVDYILMNTVQFGKVTKHSTSDKGSITISLASGSFSADKSANVVGFEDVAKDDYVLASYMGGKLYVEKAETITGTLNAYKNNSDNKVTTKLTVDDTDYNVSAVGAITVASDEVYPAKDLFSTNTSYKAELDTECTFYLDANGYIIARGQLEEAVYNYVYVKARDNGTATVDSRVKVVTPDGKTGTYNLSDKSAVKLASINAGDVYAYSLTNDGKDIKLTNAKTVVSGRSATFDKGKSTITIAGAATQYATGSTVFYYVDNNGGVTTYQGRDKAPSISASRNTTVYKNNAGTVVAVVFTGVTGKTSVGDHLFVYAKGNIASDYTLANVVMNGKDEVEKNVKIDTNSSFSADTLYTYEVNSDGYYEIDPVDSEGFYTDGTVAQVYGNTIVVSGGKNPGEFVISSKTVVIDNDGNPGTPDVAFNGNINKGDAVQLLVEDNDKAVMVVITKRATSSNDNNQGNDSIIVDGGNVTGTAMSAYDTAANINAELKNNNVILTGNWTNVAANGLSIPAGRILVVKGDLDATNQSLANSGTVIVTGDYKAKATEAVIGDVQAGSMTLAGATSLTGKVVVSGNVTGAHALTVNKDASLTVGGDVANQIVANGNVDVRGSVKAGGVNANGATVKVGKNVTGAMGLNNSAVVEITGNATGILTLNNGSLTVGGTLDASTGYTFVKGSLTVGGDLKTNATAVVADTNRSVEVAGAILTTGTIDVANGVTLSAGALGDGTATGAVTVTDGDLTVTGDAKTAAVTVTKGSLTVGGDLNSSAAITVGSGTTDADTAGTLTVGKAVATSGLTLNKGEAEVGSIDTVTQVEAKTTLTVKGDVATLADAKGEVIIGGNVTTEITDVNGGSVTVDGTVADIKDITSGTVTVDGTIAKLTAMTDGTLTANGNITTVTAVTKGTLNLNGTVTLPNFTANDVTLNLGATAVVTLDDSQSGTLKVSGVDGAKLTNGTGAAIGVPSGLFYNDSGVGITTLTASKDYVYGTDTYSNVGFIQQP